MSLASNPANIRFNGTGRLYAGPIASPSFQEIGELESLNFNTTISTEKLKSSRTAARATILEVETEREASLSFGMREMSEDNLKMALLGSAVNIDNQAAGHVWQDTPAFADDLFIDLGKLNLFITRISGAVTGTPAVGDTVTGATSSATGRIAYAGTGVLILVNVSGVFQAGEQIEVDVSNYITASGIEKLEDVCLTSSDGATLRTQGTDYSLDPDYGYLRKNSDGAMTGTDVVSLDHESVNRKYLHGLSAGSVERRIIAVTDPGDEGPRQRWTFHRVKIALNGDFPLIGEGEAVLQVNGSVLSDTAQPAGQEYYKTEMM